MGTKVTISPITNPENSSFPSELNDAIDVLSDEFDQVIYRDGSFDFTGDLDMGSNRIFNLPAPVNPTEPLRLVDIDSVAAGEDGEDGAPGADAENPAFTFDISTGLPGTDALLDVTGVYPALNLEFTIPRGTAGASGALGDGDYGDIVVSGTGSVLTIDAGTVNLAKMANLAAGSIIGNTTGGAAVPTAVTFSALKTAMTFVKADVGLGNVDNTSDANKPISTATQTALDALDTAVDGKASAFLTVTDLAANTTLTDTHNNNLLRFTGSTARVVTLNSTPTAGFSAICAHRGTVAAWTLTIAGGAYLNGATTTTTSITVGLGAHFTAIHEGSGVWTVDGTELS